MMNTTLRVLSLIILVLICSPEMNAQSEFLTVSKLTNDNTQFRKIEFDLTLSVAFANPYDQDDIQLDMILQSPSGATVVLPCFYFSGGSIESHWRARFAPKEGGTYSYYFRLQKQGTAAVTTTPETMNVVPSASDGFISSVNKSAMYYDSGKPFLGIGQNIAWEGRSWEPDQYTYEYFLTKLKANGGNYFRTWSGPWNLPLEWTKVVDTDRYSNENGYFHSEGIQRMDELVKLCDSLDLHFMLALEWHGSLQTGDRWNLNPYNAINGGPASTPTEFFTADAARKRYKNKLRYVVARWGYSKSVAAWEFFNEVDNAVYNGSESTIAIPHASVTEWHREMAKYLKSIDPYDHLVTTSVSHREISGLFNLAELDIVQKHIYRATGNLPEIIIDNNAKFNKPFVIGEFGYDWDWNNINDTNAANLEFDYKRGLWYGLFSQTPILPMSWWWEFFDEKKTDEYFPAVKYIAERMWWKSGTSQPTQVNVSSAVISVEAMGVKAGDTYFVYLLNNSSSATTNKTFAMTVSSQGTFTVHRFNPETKQKTLLATVSSSAGTLQLSGLSFTERECSILIITPQGGETEMQRPFTTGQVIPGIIEAEHYDVGGENISFNDSDNINAGGAFRNDGVDLFTEGERTFAGETIPGEWLEYSIETLNSGTYDFSMSLRGGMENKNIQFLIDDQFIESINVPASSDWTSIDFTSPIIRAGQHTFRIVFNAGGIELDKISVTLSNEAPFIALQIPQQSEYLSLTAIPITASVSDSDGSITAVAFYINGLMVSEDATAPFVYDWIPHAGNYVITATATDNAGLFGHATPLSVTVVPDQRQFPYPDEMAPHNVPGKIEAEHFDSGGPGAAYTDKTDGNIKSDLRPDTDVDIEICSDEGGGYNLADIQADEWVEYTINVVNAGYYQMNLRVATSMSGQTMSILINDTLVVANLRVPNTGAWQGWKDVSTSSFRLTKGIKILKLSFNSEYFNLNHFTITEADAVTSIEKTEYRFSLYPNPANEHLWIDIPANVRSITILESQGKILYNKTSISKGVFRTPKLSPGMYLIVIEDLSGRKEHLKAIIK
jgi:hypothetical protein